MVSFDVVLTLLKNPKYILKLLKKLIRKHSGKSFLLLNCCTIALGFIYIRIKKSKNCKNAQLNKIKTLARFQSTFKNDETSTTKKNQPTLNKQFFNEICYLLKIMFPKLLSKQFFYLVFHTFTLISRTFISIYVARLDGALVKSIVKKNPKEFFFNLIKWLTIAIPATTCNSFIKYLESKLDLELRTCLIDKSLNMYFDKRIYYKIALKQYDNIQIDQNLTDDIDKLTNILVHLYSQLTKPILDISLITYTLISVAKENDFNYLLPTSIAIVVVATTGSLLRRISPKFGHLVAEEAKRKGYLRFLYSRIQTNSEEIAFYGGEKNELNLIKRNFNYLKEHLNLIYSKKLWYVIIEQFLMKYVWSGAGLLMVSLPLLIASSVKNDAEQDEGSQISWRTEQFTMARNLLTSAADAVERILTSYKEIIELTGYTRRVYDMFQIFQNTEIDTIENIDTKKMVTFRDNLQIDRTKPPAGKIVEDPTTSNIVVESIQVVTPNGDVIVPCLSLRLHEGMNLLITGPNGCGKSSFFRIICGLWPLYSGSIQRPKLKDLFYIPQKPYLPIGTLRDQIIYPDSKADMNSKGLTDDDLMNVLNIVYLQHVVAREGGLDAIADWKDVLSGGEKQRVGLARLFYHKPKYAFLDECTSAISIDVEGKIYQTAKNEYKITLLTIAHRASLWQYHNYILQFDGHGNWKFEELNDNLDQRLNLKQEKDNLEKQLLGVSNSKLRLQELCSILGEDSIALQ